MFSYYFCLDGSIKVSQILSSIINLYIRLTVFTQVEVRASGYIQPAFFAHNQDYGYHIHDSLSSSMHDHVLNFTGDVGGRLSQLHRADRPLK